MLSRMAPSSPPVMRTLHLLRTPDILCANDNRPTGSYTSVNSFETAGSLCTGREISSLLGRTQVAAFRCIQHGTQLGGLQGSPSPLSWSVSRCGMVQEAGNKVPVTPSFRCE